MLGDAINGPIIHTSKIIITFAATKHIHLPDHARMAESVDATVPNTVGAIHPVRSGSGIGRRLIIGDYQPSFLSEVYYLFRVNKKGQ